MPIKTRHVMLHITFLVMAGMVQETALTGCVGALLVHCRACVRYTPKSSHKACSSCLISAASAALTSRCDPLMLTRLDTLAEVVCMEALVLEDLQLPADCIECIPDSISTYTCIINTDTLVWLLQLLSRLDSPAAVNQCVEALVHGDLQLPSDGTYSISDALLPLYIPGEATSARRLWLADIFVALLQRAQVCIPQGILMMERRPANCKGGQHSMWPRGQFRCLPAVHTSAKHILHTR